jgi:NAD(P)-dependent dehydrogenase (short-subunit alcohol dehydrogenase family)
MGRKALAVKADLTKIDSIEEMVQRTIAKFGTIDCLINNAGVSGRKPFLETTPEEFDRISSINFKAVYFASQVVAREMIARGGGGKIINVASAAGYLVRSGMFNSVYAGTKAGVIMFTKSFASELAPHKISVNAVAPGYFRTSAAAERLQDPKTVEAIVSVMPIKKIGEAQDIIGPVLFLASDLSTFITGQTIFVDGGRTIY